MGILDSEMYCIPTCIQALAYVHACLAHVLKALHKSTILRKNRALWLEWGVKRGPLLHVTQVCLMSYFADSVSGEYTLRTSSQGKHDVRPSSLRPFQADENFSFRMRQRLTRP